MGLLRLESPESFGAHFGLHNSLCIFKRNMSRGIKPFAVIFSFLFPLQRMKRPALQKKFYEWLFVTSRNGPKGFKCLPLYLEWLTKMVDVWLILDQKDQIGCVTQVYLAYFVQFTDLQVIGAMQSNHVSHLKETLRSISRTIRERFLRFYFFIKSWILIAQKSTETRVTPSFSAKKVKR